LPIFLTFIRKKLPITKKNGRQELSSKKIHMPCSSAEIASVNPHNFILPLYFPAVDPPPFDQRLLNALRVFLDKLTKFRLFLTKI
jgi:hypothetical protein